MGDVDAKSVFEEEEKGKERKKEKGKKHEPNKNLRLELVLGLGLKLKIFDENLVEIKKKSMKCWIKKRKKKRNCAIEAADKLKELMGKKDWYTGTD